VCQPVPLRNRELTTGKQTSKSPARTAAQSVTAPARPWRIIALRHASAAAAALTCALRRPRCLVPRTSRGLPLIPTAISRPRAYSSGTRRRSRRRPEACSTPLSRLPPGTQPPGPRRGCERRPATSRREAPRPASCCADRSVILSQAAVGQRQNPADRRRAISHPRCVVQPAAMAPRVQAGSPCRARASPLPLHAGRGVLPALSMGRRSPGAAAGPASANPADRANAQRIAPFAARAAGAATLARSASPSPGRAQQHVGRFRQQARASRQRGNAAASVTPSRGPRARSTGHARPGNASNARRHCSILRTAHGTPRRYSTTGSATSRRAAAAAPARAGMRRSRDSCAPHSCSSSGLGLIVLVLRQQQPFPWMQGRVPAPRRRVARRRSGEAPRTKPNRRKHHPALDIGRARAHARPSMASAEGCSW